MGEAVWQVAVSFGNMLKNAGLQATWSIWYAFAEAVVVTYVSTSKLHVAL